MFCICGVANPEMMGSSPLERQRHQAGGIRHERRRNGGGEAARTDRTLRTRGHTVRRTSDCLIAAVLHSELPRDTL